MGKINCGKYKCLFRQKRDHQRENIGRDNYEIGWLVGSTCRKHQFEAEMELAWKLAQQLRSTYQTNHLFLEAPRRVMVTPSALELFSSDRAYTANQRECEKDPMYLRWNFTIVQKVKIAPNPMLVIKVSQRNSWKYSLRQFFRNKVVNKSSFLRTLREDIGPALYATEGVPLLGHDFQIIIDGEGNIYQLDLDRAFHARLLGGEFIKSFAREYDDSIELLKSIASWAPNRRKEKKIRSTLKNRTTGQSVLTNCLQKSSSLSCEALNVVREMSGWEGNKTDRSRDAMLMMVHLVTTALSFDRLHDDEPERKGMFNCTL